MNSVPTPNEPIYVPSAKGALRQGEIISDLVQARLALETINSDEAPEIDYIEHPWAITVSQDCDLDQDFKARQPDGSSDKKIPNILFCEVSSAKVLRDHTSMNPRIWDRVKINKDERYQFLEGVPSEEDALGEGLPELAIDFKRYFTIPSDEVYQRLDPGANAASLFLSDLKDPAGLAAKLRSAPDLVSHYLQEQFPSDLRELLENYPDSTLITEALQKSIIDQLRRVLETSSLYEEQRFAQVTLPPSTRKMIERNPTGSDLIRLNWALLVAAYPTEIRKRPERRCRLVSPYLEHFSTRFCYYQYRVALPRDHFSVPGSF